MSIDRRLLITSVVAAAAGAVAGPASAADPDTRSLVVKFAAALSAHDLTAFAALFGALLRCPPRRHSESHGDDRSDRGQLAEHWGMGDIAGVNAPLHSSTM